MKKWEERYGEIKDFKYSSSQIKQKKKDRDKSTNFDDSNIQKENEAEEKEVVVGKCTVKVEKIRELWTRFETHHKKLIVKFF